MPKTDPQTASTAGQTLYRLSVMVGTLSIGSMAAYLYGPPPEKLASLINTAAGSLNEMYEHRNSAPAGANPSTLPEAPAASTLYAASEKSNANLGSQVVTNNGFATIEPIDQLLQAGAKNPSITPWGLPNPTTGKSLYRAAASIPVANSVVGSPVSGGPVTSGLVQQVDAIGGTPQEAAEALLAQLSPRRL